MPINPLIPLAGDKIDIAGAARRGTQERQHRTVADMVIEQKRTEIEQSNALQEIKRTGTYARDTVLPLLQAGKTEELKANLIERIDKFDQSGTNADGSRKALQMLQEGNLEELQRTSQNVVRVAQDNKLLGQRVEQVTNEQGQIVAQRKPTGEEIASPRAGAALKGKKIEVQDQDSGEIFFAIEAPDGQIVDAVTRQHLPNVRKAPKRTVAGKPGDFRTPSQKGKDQQASTEAEIGLRQNVTDMNNLRSLIASDDFVGGVAGDAVSVVNSLAAQVRQLTDSDHIILDGELNREAFADGISKENMTRFRKAAITADRFESAVLELAFLKAKSLNPDGKISDADVRAAQKILGRGADKASRLTLLDDIMKRTVRHFNISQQVLSGKSGVEPTDLTVDEILGRTTEAEAGADAATGDPDSIADRLLKDAGL